MTPTIGDFSRQAFMINLRILKLVEIFVKLGFIAHILGCGFL